jgi:hypothetical protein
VTATPTDDDNGNGCTSRVYINYCLPAIDGAPFWVVGIHTADGTTLEEQIVPAGSGRLGFDVRNNADLKVWAWNEVDGSTLMAEFFSGYCEYPEVWTSLCDRQPTPTPTPKMPEILPVTGGERVSNLRYLVVGGLVVIILFGVGLWFNVGKYLQ